jgi:hypothetical protein
MDNGVRGIGSRFADTVTRTFSQLPPTTQKVAALAATIFAGLAIWAFVNLVKWLITRLNKPAVPPPPAPPTFSGDTARAPVLEKRGEGPEGGPATHATATSPRAHTPVSDSDEGDSSGIDSGEVGGPVQARRPTPLKAAEDASQVSVSFEVSEVSGVVVTVASAVLGQRSDSTGTVVEVRDRALSVDELSAVAAEGEVADPDEKEDLYSSGGPAAGDPPASPPVSPIRPALASVGPGSVAAVATAKEGQEAPTFEKIQKKFLESRENLKTHRKYAGELYSLLLQIRLLQEDKTLGEGELETLKKYKRYIDEFITPMLEFFRMVNSLGTNPTEAKRIADDLLDKTKGPMKKALEYCVSGQFLKGFELSQVFYWPAVADRVQKLDLTKYPDDESRRQAAGEVLGRAIKLIESGKIDEAKDLWKEMSFFLQMVQNPKDPVNRDLQMSTVYLKYMVKDLYQCSNGSEFLDKLFKWLQDNLQQSSADKLGNRHKFLMNSRLNISLIEMNQPLVTDFQGLADKYGMSIQVRRVLGDGKAATCVDIKSSHSDAPTLILEHGYDGNGHQFRICEEAPTDQSFMNESYVTACEESFAHETSFTNKETQPPADE